MIQFLALAGGYVYRVATNPAAQKLAREAIKKIGAREVKQPRSTPRGNLTQNVLDKNPSGSLYHNKTFEKINSLIGRAKPSKKNVDDAVKEFESLQRLTNRRLKNTMQNDLNKPGAFKLNSKMKKMIRDKGGSVQ
jgi:hypothetical protein